MPKNLEDATSLLSSIGDKMVSIDPHTRMLVEDIYQLPSELRRSILEELIEMSEKYKNQDNQDNNDIY